MCKQCKTGEASRNPHDHGENNDVLKWNASSCITQMCRPFLSVHKLYTSLWAVVGSTWMPMNCLFLEDQELFLFLFIIMLVRLSCSALLRISYYFKYIRRTAEHSSSQIPRRKTPAIGLAVNTYCWNTYCLLHNWFYAHFNFIFKRQLCLFFHLGSIIPCNAMQRFLPPTGDKWYGIALQPRRNTQANKLMENSFWAF